MSTEDRSQSRGREVYSSGRGGAGNIRSSVSREPRPTDGPDDFSVARGREPMPAQTRSFSIGRGGAGNIRSPSRDKANKSTLPTTPDLTEEEQIIRAHVQGTQESPLSTGRGGIGNIANRSLSRGAGTNPPPASPGVGSPVRSTGRGGAGNIVHGDGYHVEVIDEDERKEHFHHEGLHSTGRGGSANISTTHEPAVEHHGHAHSDFESTGRGGAGNMVRERSASRHRD
ncbi:hypothetical protein Hypma_002242 [Hypsizygus marmoreus]|uniref:Protein PAR32 n=1 Tax=Hypsizygus marmoreus TaxID=39966 RepID=A0A369K5R3_HYPMA|nr:hypothetical protein Hypma_002242 [Hypsizygus marmoreus]